MALADTWYKVAGTLEAYSEAHEPFLMEVSEHIASIERLAKRLSDISNREITPANGDGAADISVQVWWQAKNAILTELSRHRLGLIQVVQNAALASDDIRRLGRDVIRP